ncbi:hypothetical protein SHKM778_05400 [Streptomyces sp. KM77-8]|uniref:Uncharacterized protein n=1 Tax=Streptomyces haneummycinicus TaxID=3074435 RepID=A0AAT9H9T9_9ACTN
MRQGGVQGRAGRLEDGQRGRGDAVAGPAAGDGPLGGTAAPRAVVDVPHEFPAQGRAEDEPAVAGEVRHGRAGAGLDDGERRAGAFHLAGRGGEQRSRGGRLHAEHGGHLVGGEPVPDGEFERLALLGRGAGGLRPGQLGQFAAALPQDVVGDGRDGNGPDRSPAARAAHRAGALPSLPGFRELAQTRPAGQGVEPGPAAAGFLGACRPRRSARVRTSARAAVAASWSQSTDRQYVNRPSRWGSYRVAGHCASVRAAPRSRTSRCVRWVPVVRVVRVEVSGPLLVIRRP